MVNKKGRPPPPTSVEYKKKCMEYYEQFKSAGYAAEKLGIHRHTAEAYYKIFKSKELEETDDEFIQGQRYAKAMTIKKLDFLLEKADGQIERCETMIGDGDQSTEGINFERILQRSIMDAKELSFQKAELIMTPTLDLEIVAAIAKRDGQPSEDTTTTKPESKKRSK